MIIVKITAKLPSDDVACGLKETFSSNYFEHVRVRQTLHSKDPQLTELLLPTLLISLFIFALLSSRDPRDS